MFGIDNTSIRCIRIQINIDAIDHKLYSKLLKSINDYIIYKETVSLIIEYFHYLKSFQHISPFLHLTFVTWTFHFLFYSCIDYISKCSALLRAILKDRGAPASIIDSHLTCPNKAKIQFGKCLILATFNNKIKTDPIDKTKYLSF